MQRKNDYFSRQSYERKEKQARGEKLHEMRTKSILNARCSSPLPFPLVHDLCMSPPTQSYCYKITWLLPDTREYQPLYTSGKKTRFSFSHGHPPGRGTQRSFSRQLFCAASGMLAAVDQVIRDSASDYGCA